MLRTKTPNKAQIIGLKVRTRVPEQNSGSFKATVCKKDGEDYEPNSLRIMVTAIDRYLTEKEYKHSIIRDREFKSSKQVLDGKARLMRQQLRQRQAAEQGEKSDNNRGK